MRRSLLPLFAIVILLGQVTPVTAGEDPAPSIQADLEGTPIAIGDIPSYACHDLDFPQIHCFQSSATRSQAIAERRIALGPAAVAAAEYAVVFSSTSYAGTSMVISQDYDTLALVGWNDWIRSFKGRNSETGEFWTDWFATGSRLSFCCNVNDASLPSNLDRAITSVYRT